MIVWTHWHNEPLLIGTLVIVAWAYALAARGEAGVAQALAIIRAELAVAMALTGCTDLRQAGRDLLA